MLQNYIFLSKKENGIQTFFFFSLYINVESKLIAPLSVLNNAIKRFG